LIQHWRTKGKPCSKQCSHFLINENPKRRRFVRPPHSDTIFWCWS
jgi:hypothetical protein